MINLATHSILQDKNLPKGSKCTPYWSTSAEWIKIVKILFFKSVACVNNVVNAVHPCDQYNSLSTPSS